MKQVYFIRHWESTANIWLRTSDHATVILTEKWIQQAKQIADFITKQPDLIIHSIFTRTRETAEPLIQKFPEAPIEEWKNKEFCYLDPIHYHGTTVSDRQIPARAYWNRCDPYYVDWEGAESFADWVERVWNTIQDLEKAPGTFIVMFSHERTIWLIRLLLSKNFPKDIHHLMLYFRDFCLPNPAKNGEILEATYDETTWWENIKSVFVPVE